MASPNPVIQSFAYRVECWALALGAVYHVLYEKADRFDEIPFDRMDSIKHLHGAGSARTTLTASWDINGILPSERKKKAIKTLNWLVYEGHRAPFQHEIDFAGTGELPHLAWDLARAVHLAQTCYAAGYILAEEAWHYVFAAALLAQSNFRSWSHFGQCYLTGHKLWSDEQNNGIEQALHWLSSDPRSPWTRAPWDLTLEVSDRLFRNLNPFALSESFASFFAPFGYRRGRALAFIQNSRSPESHTRLSVGVHVNAEGELELNLSAGVRFDVVEQLMWPHRSSRMACTMGADLNRLRPAASPRVWKVSSIDDLSSIQREIAREMPRTILPYLDRISTIEQAQRALTGTEAERYCGWTPEIRSMIAACMDAVSGRKESARAQLKTLSTTSLDKAIRAYTPEVLARVSALP